MAGHGIRVTNVSKYYKIYPSRRERLREWLMPFAKMRHEKKWVLRDINLDVQPGEAVGIIGMNGAGKSTLLKILTGTTIPSDGLVETSGKVAALLELGMGFHPDFTGRENVYTSGQLLGYRKDEIDACMKDVEAFAEIGNAIDAPVRTYSSGMQVRLAFSVATMKRPDILIVDEALSVGDAYFQHKSFGRIQSFCKSGTTLLLVSHDAGAIQAVCDRAVLMDRGQIIRAGLPEEIMDEYNAMIGGNEDVPIQRERAEDGRLKVISGTREVRTEQIRLLNEQGASAELFGVGELMTLMVEISVNADLKYLNCGFSIKNNYGQILFGTNTSLHGKSLENVKAGRRIRVSYQVPLNLGEGNYSISTAFVGDANSHTVSNYEWTELAAVFQVVNTKRLPFAGETYLPAQIKVTCA